MTAVPVDLYCRQHRKDFFTKRATLRTSSGAPMAKTRDPTPRWLYCQIIRCWHCACVIIRLDDKHEAGCLNCLCDFCPRLKSKHYFRAGACRPGQGLYMWDGPDSGSRSKKMVRARTIREVGGQVVGVSRVCEDVIWYVGEAAR